MSTVSAVLKAVILYFAERVSSITDWFQTEPEWANREVLESTELKTTGGSESQTSQKEYKHCGVSCTVNLTAGCFSVHERHKAKSLWEKTGAVIMVVRRPG